MGIKKYGSIIAEYVRCDVRIVTDGYTYVEQQQLGFYFAFKKR